MNCVDEVIYDYSAEERNKDTECGLKVIQRRYNFTADNDFFVDWGEGIVDQPHLIDAGQSNCSREATLQF